MIRAFAPEELYTFVPEKAAYLMQFAVQSKELFGWLEPDGLIFLCGLIPFPTHAYIWTHTNLDLVATRRIAYGLKAHRIVRTGLLRYRTLVGHCLPCQQRWLISLGATLRPGPQGHLIFQIEAH